MVGMNFRPHITLSSFKGQEPADSDLHVRQMTFRADRLHVCELGQSHTCHRIIREIFRVK
jgi:2'-5' RNA ligase